MLGAASLTTDDTQVIALASRTGTKHVREGGCVTPSSIEHRHTSFAHVSFHSARCWQGPGQVKNVTAHRTMLLPRHSCARHWQQHPHVQGGAHADNVLAELALQAGLDAGGAGLAADVQRGHDHCGLPRARPRRRSTAQQLLPRRRGRAAAATPLHRWPTCLEPNALQGIRTGDIEILMR